MYVAEDYEAFLLLVERHAIHMICCLSFIIKREDAFLVASHVTKSNRCWRENQCFTGVKP
jgi:hypothetical protein